MVARGFRCLLIALTTASAVAQTPRVLVQTSPLAGYSYHAGPAVWNDLRLGDELNLVREPNNPADPFAVRVDWQGHVIGYLPRIENGPLAEALARGSPLTGRIARLREHRNPRDRVLIDVFVGLPAKR